MHETAEEAWAETERMLEVYADFCEQSLAIPVIRGRKTDKEKFAGAEATYTIEAMMHDGKALQSGTSHYFGDGFSRAFGIQFAGRDNQMAFPHQTSWGMSSRIIGAIIMTHGDDSGLVLPPAVAPVQAVVLPIAQHKPGVLEKAEEVRALLASVARVKMDGSDNSAGWKFAEYEMKGVPLRIEVGPRDMEAGGCTVVRRDNREKVFVPFEALATEVPRLLQEVQAGLYAKALAHRETMMYTAQLPDEMKQIADEKPGFIKAMWCGDEACEMKLKEVAGVTSRCRPHIQEHVGDTCVCCGKPTDTMVVWGKAY